MKSSVCIEKGEPRNYPFSNVEDGDYFLLDGHLYVKITESVIHDDMGSMFNCMIVRSGTLYCVKGNTTVQIVDVDITYRVK